MISGARTKYIIRLNRHWHRSSRFEANSPGPQLSPWWIGDVFGGGGLAQLVAFEKRHLFSKHQFACAHLGLRMTV
uniref:Uncharacterized protein n=1 Tax=Globodera rostochiensis TaxID=31243 RepID=A0A914HDL6_GLORO